MLGIEIKKGREMTERDELNGWGEIASFLKVSLVTAWRFERKYGLPIERLCGTQVRASRVDIIRWKSENSIKNPTVK